jgi:transcription elongation factor GreA
MPSMMQQKKHKVEMRIAKLEEVHSNARLIDETNLIFLKCVLSNVKIKNQSNGMEMKL